MPTVYITAPRDEASDLATALVEERHAACVNRVDCTSTYRWDGDVVEDEEEILLAKTTDDGIEELVAFVEREHPYDVPCVEQFDEDAVLPAYADWVQDTVEA